MRSSLLPLLRWAVLCLVIAPEVAAEPVRLGPYKDELFAYPAIVGSAYGGDYVVIAFDHQRDVVARDEIPDEKTRPEYVSLEVKSSEGDFLLNRDGQSVRYVGVGRTAGNAAIITIFVHGLGATRFDGANDWRSGGNINRIKNLMLRNDGVYLSTDHSMFKSKAKRQIAALMKAYAESSPGAPIILICASIGARPCWELMEDPDTAALIDGVIMIAGVSDGSFARRATVRDPARWIPIYIAHGNEDRSVNWRGQEELFKAVKAAAPGYPIRMAVFDTGTHRAPLRMTDWRLAINWMLEVGGE